MKSIRINFTSENPLSLPMARNEIMQGLFYNLVGNDPALSSQLHDMDIKQKSEPKNFCFGDIEGRYSIKGKRIVFFPPLSWEIRSADDNIIQTIYSRLSEKPHFQINQSLCEVTSLEMGMEKSFKDKISFKMKTPLCICTSEGGYKMFFTPEEADFFSLAKANIINKYKNYYNAEPEGEVEFKKIGDRHRKLLTRYKGGVVEGYFGRYELEADEKMLKLAYYAGLGMRNSLGFGMIETDRDIN